jgi:hypothetical protein
MVEDRQHTQVSKKSPKENEENIPETQDKKGDGGWMSSAKQWVQGMFSQVTDRHKEGDIKTEQWKAAMTSRRYGPSSIDIARS